jgi:uncharacterized membrane-anchored protein
MDALARETLLQRAAAQGLLPAGARWPQDDPASHRPWPVLLLTALGAWLAALPLMMVVGLMFSRFLEDQVGATLVGAALVAAGAVLLRQRQLPLFVEQLAFPLLLVGGGALAYGLERALGMRAVCALLSLLCLGVAALVPRAWLRLLLGAGAAGLVVAALTVHWHTERGLAPWLAWHLALLALVGAQQALQRAQGASAQALESLASGWAVATLAGLALWSGVSFLVGGVMGEVGRDLAAVGLRQAHWSVLARQATSALLAAGAAALAAHAWPVLRTPWHALVGAVLVALAWFMPSLGGVLLVLAFTATSGRGRLAVVAALAAAWIVGAFYYQLAWPLATKALVLGAAGALLAGLSALALRWQRAAAQTPAAPAPAAGPATEPAAQGPFGLRRAALALGLLAPLAVANVGIWQKQQLIAQGQPVFVALAPADPRSLMQGDFMRLNFRLPSDLRWNTQDRPLTGARPKVLARRDARGVAEVAGLYQGQALAEGEVVLELTPKDGAWVLVTDAWYFKEGEAERWQQARFGEFRVLPSGQALLVGLRGENLQPL